MDTETNQSELHKPHFIKLSDIAGLHKKVRDLETEYSGIPPYSYFGPQDLPAEVIHSMLQQRPIIYRPLNGKNYCIGNIRMYQLAVDCLDPSTEVHASQSMVKRFINREISQLFWSEFLFHPLTTDAGKKRHHWLYDLWLKFNQSACSTWKAQPLTAIQKKRHFAKLINIDERTLK